MYNAVTAHTCMFMYVLVHVHDMLVLSHISNVAHLINSLGIVHLNLCHML